MTGDSAIDAGRRACYGNADIFLMCFDVMNRATFQSLRTKWLPDIRAARGIEEHKSAGAEAGPMDRVSLMSPRILLVGLKSDTLNAERQCHLLRAHCPLPAEIVWLVEGYLRPKPQPQKSHAAGASLAASPDALPAAVTLQEIISFVLEEGACGYVECTSKVGDGSRRSTRHVIQRAIRSVITDGVDTGGVPLAELTRADMAMFVAQEITRGIREDDKLLGLASAVQAAGATAAVAVSAGAGASAASGVDSDDETVPETKHFAAAAASDHFVWPTVRSPVAAIPHPLARQGSGPGPGAVTPAAVTAPSLPAAAAASAIDERDSFRSVSERSRRVHLLRHTEISLGLGVALTGIQPLTRSVSKSEAAAVTAAAVADSVAAADRAAEQVVRPIDFEG